MLQDFYNHNCDTMHNKAPAPADEKTNEGVPSGPRGPKNDYLEIWPNYVYIPLSIKTRRTRSKTLQYILRR